jgi:hypothetical protein
LKDDWKFNYNDVKDEETKEQNREDPFASLELLLHVASSLIGIAKRFSNGNLSLFSEVCESLDLWNATNYARLWPERHHSKIDQILQDALAHISDTHFMIEGVYCLGPGEEQKRYKNAFPKIVQEVRYAIKLVKEAIELLDIYIEENLGGGDETNK